MPRSAPPRPRRRRPTRPLGVLGLLALSTACGSTSFDGTVGAFSVSLEGSPPRLELRHPSGLVLTSGPEAFAVRAADARYEMAFGMFRIDDRPRGDWRAAASIGRVETEGEVVRAELRDADGAALARLRIEPEGTSLRVTLDAIDGDDTRSRIRLACDDPSRGGFLGFGAQTHDVDHRGQIVPVWVSEQGIGKVDTDVQPDVWFLVGTRHSSYLPVPTMLAPRGDASWGLDADTLQRTVWDLCATDPGVLGVEAWGPSLPLRVAPGPSPLDVVAQQTERLGRPPLGPDWTFGVWMERIGGTEAVRDEARRLRAADVPVSAIWSEDWRGAKRQGAMTVLEEDWFWDEALYPELPALIDALHADGIALQVYFNTFVSESADVWDEAWRDGHLVRRPDGTPFIFDGVKFEDSGLADLYRPESRAWVERALESALALGADGWMADFAEWYPADRADVTPPEGLDGPSAHQRYPVLWAEVNRAVAERSGRDDLVWFHRSGYSGSQGVAPVIWAGDQRTSFQEDDGLPTIVPILLGLSVTGFPVVTHDIAGYVSATNPPAAKDLFLRWTTLGALAPVMRTHHGRNADQNWRWDRDAETAAIFGDWARLHTRLFPLWKGLAREASTEGRPILRPLAFADPGDVRLHGVKDAYLVGDQLLVAPVVTASTASRVVPFPRGRWFDWFGDTHVDGPTDREIAVPLDTLGLFARAGAVVPLLPEGVDTLRSATSTGVVTLDSVRRQRTLRVWLGANGGATDADGGRWTLESPSAPSGELTPSGPAELRERGERILRLHQRGDGELRWTEPSGAVHVLRASGLGADMEVEIEVRW